MSVIGDAHYGQGVHLPYEATSVWMAVAQPMAFTAVRRGKTSQKAA